MNYIDISEARLKLWLEKLYQINMPKIYYGEDQLKMAHRALEETRILSAEIIEELKSILDCDKF